jgi:hypothetical protein
MPNAIGRNALIIGPLLLMGFILVLWFGYNRSQTAAVPSDFHQRKIREHREQLLDRIVSLDRQYETAGIEVQDYQKQREDAVWRLRRIFLLLKK